jgi:superfamily I DNA/RNA helicase
MLVVTFTARRRPSWGRLHHALLQSRSALAGLLARPANIRHQLAALPRAQISTIHSFCAEVIRRHGHLAGLELGPQLDEQEAALLRHELARTAGSTAGRVAGGARTGPVVGRAGWHGTGGPVTGMYGRGLREPLLRLHDLYCALVDPQVWQQQHVDLPPLAADRLDLSDPAVASFEEELAAWREHAVQVHEDVAQRFAETGISPAYLQLSARRCSIAAELTIQGWEATAAPAGLPKEKQDDIKYKPSLLTTSARHR